jgi:hypothetical protein
VLVGPRVTAAGVNEGAGGANEVNVAVAVLGGGVLVTAPVGPADVVSAGKTGGAGAGVCVAGRGGVAVENGGEGVIASWVSGIQLASRPTSSISRAAKRRWFAFTLVVIRGTPLAQTFAIYPFSDRF